MAVAGVLATALTTQAAWPNSLYVGGVDMILAPGTQGLRAGVPLESVTVTEAGPGGVSSMSFVVEDSGLTQTVAEGMDVRFERTFGGARYPLFYGWVQGFDVEPAFGEQGRVIKVEAVGVEAVLDWGKTNIDLTFPGGTITSVAAAIQSIVANSTGLGSIRALSNAGTVNGDQAAPIAPTANVANVNSFSIPTGTTVREAIRLIVTAVASPGFWEFGSMVTVDFWYGLRVWEDKTAGGLVSPDDYQSTIEDVVNTGASATNSEDLSYTVDATGVPAAVVVRGAALAVVVPAGTGRMGDVASINDSTITTILDAQLAGRAYLNAFRSGLRGSYRKSDRVLPASGQTIHVGSRTTITDARVALSAAQFRIMQIVKTFNPSGRENWTVSFGGLPQSATSQMRRLTRTTLS